MNSPLADRCYPLAVPVGARLPTYRLYRLDGAGRINAAAEWIEAADDDQACSSARERAAAGRYELWDGNRLVERGAGRAR